MLDRVADEQELVVEVDVGPVQGERFAFAHAGADDQFVELVQRVAGPGAVLEEGHGLGG